MEYKDLSSVCKALREKRKKLNLSLEKVSLYTKLSPSILRRIETEDQLESMNQVYLKGFIKIYASFLQEEEIVKSLEEIFYSSPGTSVETARIDKTNHLRFRGRNNVHLLVGIILLIGLIIAGGIIIRKFFSPRQIHQARKTTIQKEQESHKLKTFSKKPSLLKLILALRTKAEVFLEVQVDGEEVFRDTVAAGIKDSWEGRKKIVLYVNNPSLLDIEFNGERVPVNRRRPTTYIFTPQGFKISQ